MEELQLITEKGAAAEPSAVKRLVGAVAGLRSSQVVRAALGHLSLFGALVAYTALGGLVFRSLERPSEVSRVFSAQQHLWEQRRLFVSAVSDFNASSSASFPDFLSFHLTQYEASIHSAAQHGVHHVPSDVPDQETAALSASWGYLHSVFFASTVLTTIGYGNVAPVTFWGRAFCVGFALVGIPLTLSVIADLGKLIASSLGALADQLKQNVGCVRKLVQLVNPDDETSESNRLGVILKSMSFLVAILLLLMYIAAGAYLFTLWEDWSFFEGFYFCFITMTTIGFGDLVPQRTEYMLICTLYILIGLAMTSTIIELVRQQYAESWKRMKELTARLQSLSGPITDALKKMDISRASSIDLGMLSELRDLKKTLAMTQLETKLRFPRKNKSESDWQKEMEKAMQEIRELAAPPKIIHKIVIYESSV